MLNFIQQIATVYFALGVGLVLNQLDMFPALWGPQPGKGSPATGERRQGLGKLESDPVGEEDPRLP